MHLGLHFRWREGVAAAAADSENMMSFNGLTAGRHSVVRGILAASLLLLAANAALPAEEFPFDQELILDTAPMPPAKRVPVLTIEPNGNATIDLWCKTVSARVEFSDTAIKIEPAPLPDGLPQYMSRDQCTPERISADASMLSALAQVTAWRKEGKAVVLSGPTAMRFQRSSH